MFVLPMYVVPIPLTREGMRFCGLRLVFLQEGVSTRRTDPTGDDLRHCNPRRTDCNYGKAAKVGRLKHTRYLAAFGKQQRRKRQDTAYTMETGRFREAVPTALSIQ